MYLMFLFFCFETKIKSNSRADLLTSEAARLLYLKVSSVITIKNIEYFKIYIDT